jgi:hypothetical protein
MVIFGRSSKPDQARLPSSITRKFKGSSLLQGYHGRSPKATIQCRSLPHSPTAPAQAADDQTGRLARDRRESLRELLITAAYPHRQTWVSSYSGDSVCVAGPRLSGAPWPESSGFWSSAGSRVPQACQHPRRPPLIMAGTWRKSPGTCSNLRDFEKQRVVSAVAQCGPICAPFPASVLSMLRAKSRSSLRGTRLEWAGTAPGWSWHEPLHQRSARDSDPLHEGRRGPRL